MTDPRMLIFASVAAVLVGVLTGLAPAVLARRTDVAASLKAGAREGTYHRSRTRTMLLIVQGALSIVLLVGAGLFVRSLSKVYSLDLGYDTPRLLYVSVEMRGTHLDSAASSALQHGLLARAKAIPGVENATLTVDVPFWMSWSEELFTQPRDSIHGDYLINSVSPSYFETMGVRVVRGRTLPTPIFPVHPASSSSARGPREKSGPKATPSANACGSGPTPCRAPPSSESPPASSIGIS